MINRNSLISLCVLLAGLAVGYLASEAASGHLAIRIQEKDLSETTRIRPAPDSGSMGLSLRLVDMGGVGVLPDTINWGGNYEHNQHFFEDVILVNPPFIDTAAFSRERGKLAAYAGRMARFGYNAIAFPWFLEYLNFDHVGNGREVYGEKSTYRSRHNRLASGFRELMEVAADSGLHTYLWTDMVALTPPLREYLEEEVGSMDTEDPAFWEIYRKGAEEAFERFPMAEGIIIRIGEAGAVYNKPGWDYTSELYVRTPEAVRLMLEAFLKAAEKYDRTIIFRTWSVGVGHIGDLHTNPETYHRVLEGIQSDRLVVSTKYCNGDFYSWHMFNQTLYQGSHRRITEIQAKREFEGFGIIPNYVGPLHQSALQSLLEYNQNLEGVFVWTQYGGPLRAGPLVIYPFHGFNAINDLNVYAVSRLMMDPYTRMDSITAEWVRGYFGPDPVLVERMTRFLNASYQVMLKGLYIGEFARYDVRALGLEPPPMMWIFEWDILGASSAVNSNIYYITREHFRDVLEEGSQAVQGAIAMKEILTGLHNRVTSNPDDFEQLVASVDYEIELFRLLDYYRQFFMHYYRWIDKGDLRDQAQYKLAMGQFKATVSYHEKKYGEDLNTLGMDFEEVKAWIGATENTGRSVRWARVIVVITFFLLVMGIPGFVRDRGHRRFAGTLYFDTLFRPHRVSDMNAYHGTRRLVLLFLILYLLALVVFSSFTALLFPLCMGILSLVFVLILGIFIGSGRNYDRILVVLLAPKIVILSLLLVAIAIRGPFYFWYQFWTSDLFRLLFLALYTMLIFRKFQVYVIMARKWGHRNNAGSIALVMASFGIQVLTAGLALQIFGLEESMTALNNELLVLPTGLSKILGITMHLGIPQQLPLWIIYCSSALILFSTFLYILHRRIRN